MADEESPPGGKTESDPLLPKPASPFTSVFAATFLLVVVGVLIGMHFEGWRFLTAVYVIVQIVTTIGYGDFTVTSDAMKLFCSIYVMLVLVLAAYAINFVVDAINAKNQGIMTKQLCKLEAAALEPFQDAEGKDRRALRHRARELFRPYNDFIIASALATAFVLFGAIFYATYEACVCSYGKSEVEGCIEDTYELCVSTGGYKKTWACSFYMSVITLTTVGFGDHSPRSKVGRAVAVPWMLFGVAIMANWVNEVRHVFFERSAAEKHSEPHKSNHVRETFNEMNLSGTGQLTKAEYRCYMLQHMGLVAKEQLQDIDAHFAQLAAGSGSKGGVSFEDLVRPPSCYS